jgi:hypothetical protein
MNLHYRLNYWLRFSLSLVFEVFSIKMCLQSINDKYVLSVAALASKFSPSPDYHYLDSNLVQSLSSSLHILTLILFLQPFLTAIKLEFSLQIFLLPIFFIPLLVYHQALHTLYFFVSKYFQ